MPKKSNLPPRHLYYLGEIKDGKLLSKRYTTYATSLENAIEKMLDKPKEYQITESSNVANGWKVCTQHFPREMKSYEVTPLS